MTDKKRRNSLVSLFISSKLVFVNKKILLLWSMFVFISLHVISWLTIKLFMIYDLFVSLVAIINQTIIIYQVKSSTNNRSVLSCCYREKGANNSQPSIYMFLFYLTLIKFKTIPVQIIYITLLNIHRFYNVWNTKLHFRRGISTPPFNIPFRPPSIPLPLKNTKISFHLLKIQFFPL